MSEVSTGNEVEIPVSAKDLDEGKYEKGTSLWQDAWHRLAKNHAAVAGGIILVLLVIVSILTPWIAPYSYETQDLALGASSPSLDHFFGTDELGRDLFTRVLYGGRVSLMVGFLATAVSLVIGVLWGAVAGYIGGKVDTIMMRIVDTLYALPFIIFVILLMVVFGRNLFLLFIAIGAVEWLTMARIVRGQVINLRRQEFIEACISMGIPTKKIITKHLIPNVLGPIIVYTTLTIPSIMLFEAFLSFLGLGVQPPMSSWGLLISDGVRVMEEYPWLMIFPGLMLSITLFSLNFLGDGLRDALDPKASKD
jgi:oligopeptide transport system permease protein